MSVLKEGAIKLVTAQQTTLSNPVLIKVLSMQRDMLFNVSNIMYRLMFVSLPTSGYYNPTESNVYYVCPPGSWIERVTSLLDGAVVCNSGRELCCAALCYAVLCRAVERGSGQNLEITAHCVRMRICVCLRVRIVHA